MLPKPRHAYDACDYMALHSGFGYRIKLACAMKALYQDDEVAQVEPGCGYDEWFVGYHRAFYPKKRQKYVPDDVIYWRTRSGKMIPIGKKKGG